MHTCGETPEYALAPDVVLVAFEPIWKLTPSGRVPVSPFALMALNAVTCTRPQHRALGTLILCLGVNSTSSGAIKKLSQGWACDRKDASQALPVMTQPRLSFAWVHE